MRPFALLLVLAAVAPAAPLTKTEAARVRAHVVPSKRDLAWQRIQWLPTLWDGVIEAHERKNPILLWAMNGHILACT